MFLIRQARRRPSRRSFASQVDRLESRLLLDATRTGTWEPPHTLILKLKNGSLSAIPGVDLTINAAEFAAGPMFSGTIIGPTTPFHSGDAILDFFVDGNSTAAKTLMGADFSASMPSDIPGRNQITFSDFPVSLSPNTTHTIRVTARRPIDMPDFVAVPFPNLTILVDTTAPTVTAVGPVDPDPRNTPVPTVDVTFSDPVNLSASTLAALSLTRNGGPNLINGGVMITLVSGSTYEIGGLQGLTGDAGTYQLSVNAGALQDLAGNPGTGSVSTTWVFDPLVNQPPPPGIPDLQDGSDGGMSRTDNITSAANPTFDVAGVAPGNTLELLRNGVVVNTRVGAGAITDPAPPGGFFDYTARQVGPNGVRSVPSGALKVVIDRAPPTGSAQLDPTDATFTGGNQAATADRQPRIAVSLGDLPTGFDNAVRVDLTAVDGNTLASPVTQTLALPSGTNSGKLIVTVPAGLDPGLHSVTFTMTDLAGNTTVFQSLPFFVLASPTLEAPGTPVSSTIYNLDALVPQAAGKKLFPWNISFDRTTQTIWFVLRGEDVDPTNQPDRGNHVVQLDPATNQARLYNLGFDPDSGPHSVFFDFESHLTPRVWFTERVAGKLSYLDVASQQIVSYDLKALLKPLGDAIGRTFHADVHAVDVDRRGVAWVSDPEDGVLLEFDPRSNPDGTPTSSLTSPTGRLIVHLIPQDVLGDVTAREAGLGNVDDVGPHGLEVVVDDKTGQPFVYFTLLGPGRIAMLRPSPDPGPTGADDVWNYWDVSEALRAEGSVTGSKAVGNPLFVSIDTAETPDVPEDDRIFFSDPGSMSKPNGAIRMLLPGNALTDPNAQSSTVRTWELPAVAGAPPAQSNQTYVDRLGEVFYIDRSSGVGRFDSTAKGIPVPFQTAGRTIQAPFVTGKPTRSGVVALTMARAPINVDGVPWVDVPLVGTPGASVADLSPMDGLGQYDLKGSDNGSGRGQGPFRGTLNAGSVLYGSLTQNDQLGVVRFAELARRQMAVVAGPGDARKAFQVLRDGSLVLTEHGDGEIGNRQTNLTAAIGGPAIFGDATAVFGADGVLHVFGRDFQGGLCEYRLAPGSGTWTARSLGLPPASAGTLAANPTAFLDPVRGVGVLITTSLGHLVLYTPDSGSPTDLTTQAGAVPAGSVYSSVGVVSQAGRIIVDATNQTGDIIEYSYPAGGGPVDVRRLPLPRSRDTLAFQDVTSILSADGSTRHLFFTDGNSRLVHVSIGPGDRISAENVTELAKANAIGYSAYQMPFAGRIYSDVDAVADPNGDLYVYGTNGRDLVQFRLPANGSWQVTNLTNNVLGDPTINLPANRIFGAPAVYMTADGSQHVLMINEEGEVVEYYQLLGRGSTFNTQNITLGQAQGSNTTPSTGVDTILPPPDQTRKIGPTANPLDFNRFENAYQGVGVIQNNRDRASFLFRAPRSGRVTFSLQAPFAVLQLEAFNHRRRLVQRNRHPVPVTDKLGRTFNQNQIVLDVVAGQTYFFLVRSKPRRHGRAQPHGFGNFTLQARYPDMIVN